MSELTPVPEIEENDYNDLNEQTTASSAVPSFLASGPYQDHVVNRFFTDDDGTVLLEDSSDAFSTRATLATSSTPSLSRTLSRLSLSTRDSVKPHLAKARGDRIIPLEKLCDIIDDCKSLEAAEILSVECYREWSNMGILHRTLIFELQRPGRRNVWLRIDRRRSKTVSLRGFLWKGGKTEANDVAQLASNKLILLKRRHATPESKIAFSSRPNLGAFSSYFRAINAELLEYHIWPENCWFMCSLLQDLLFQKGFGSYVVGERIAFGLLSPLRSRVLKVAHYITSTPSSVFDRLISLDREFRVIPKLKPLTMIYAQHKSRCDLLHLPTSTDKLLHDIYSVLDLLPSTRTASDRQLFRSYAVCIVEALRDGLYPSQLIERAEELAYADEHAHTHLCILNVTRALHTFNPSAHWRTLASQLVRLARMTTFSDLGTSHLCLAEARTVLAQHPNRTWGDGQVLKAHTGTVSSVAISPDGELIATGSHDATIRFWDAQTGDSIGAPLRGHPSPVWSLIISPDGKQLISGSTDGTMRRWDVTSGKVVGEALLHSSPTDLRCFASSPDGSLMASGSDDSTVQPWDVSTGERLGEPLAGHTDWVQSLAFSPDGQRIASASQDKTVRLWDVSTGRSIGEPLKGHTRFVHAVAFSPDNNLVVSGSYDCTLRRWNATTGEPVGEAMKGHTDPVNCVVFSPNGKTIASGSDDNTIRLWDAVTGESIGKPLEGHTNWVMSIAFSPDGRQIVSGSKDCTIRIWDSLDLSRWPEAE